MSEEARALQLEREAQSIRRAESERRYRAEREREEAMTKAGVPRPYWASDYAGFDAGDIGAYYGYEHTGCPEHDSERECEAHGCNLREWCFVLTVGGKDRLVLRTSQLNIIHNGHFTDDPRIGLLAGLAYCISRKHLVLPKELHHAPESSLGGTQQPPASKEEEK